MRREAYRCLPVPAASTPARDIPHISSGGFSEEREGIIRMRRKTASRGSDTHMQQSRAAKLSAHCHRRTELIQISRRLCRLSSTRKSAHFHYSQLRRLLTTKALGKPVTIEIEPPPTVSKTNVTHTSGCFLCSGQKSLHEPTLLQRSKFRVSPQQRLTKLSWAAGLSTFLVATLYAEILEMVLLWTL